MRTAGLTVTPEPAPDSWGYIVLTFISFFRCLPDSSLAAANLAEIAWDLGNMMEPWVKLSNQGQRNIAPDLTINYVVTSEKCFVLFPAR